jgi:hypothetical protein
MVRQIGIDARGSYYYLDTGEDAIIAFEGAQPYDVYSGEDVQIVVMDNSGLIQDISTDVKDALIAIFGNDNQIRPAPAVPNSIRTTAVITPRQMAITIPESSSGGGLFSGGSIKISSETAFLIGIGVLVFAFGKSRGR